MQRVQALEERVLARITGGRTVSRAGLVEAMADAATVDSRAFQTLPELLAVVGDDPAAQPHLAALKAWLAAGAHRVDRARTGAYADQAAIALFDAWWEDAARTVLRGTLGDLADQVPRGVDDHPRQHLGSSWNNVAFYGYVDKDLRQVLGRPVLGRYSRTYCGAGSLDHCRADLRASLARAIAAQDTAQGTADVASWKYDKTQDTIVHRALGVGAVPEIDWQNRPTFQQVASFTRSRRPAPAPVGSVTLVAQAAPDHRRQPADAVRGGPGRRRCPAVGPDGDRPGQGRVRAGLHDRRDGRHG